jgi:MurNAc alpha-1-phosphate uridylyltransferase
MVANPAHNLRGDFGLDSDGRLYPHPDSPSPSALRSLTFAGIGVYRPELLVEWRAVIGDRVGARETPPHFGLTPLLRAAMPRNQVRGELWQAAWTDVGTPQRLAQLDVELTPSAPDPGNIASAR